MNDCAESQTRICKAYISDCYGHLAKSVNACKCAERVVLKKNVYDMLDRVKALLNNDVSKEETDSIDETE